MALVRFFDGSENETNAISCQQIQWLYPSCDKVGGENRKTEESARNAFFWISINVILWFSIIIID